MFVTKTQSLQAMPKKFIKFPPRLLCLLFYIFILQNLFSQQRLTKEQILNEYRTFQTNPDIDSLFRWDIHIQTRAALENLLMSRIDTILVYSVCFPGSVLFRNDTCATTYPIQTYFFWLEKGRNFFKKIDGRCESEQSAVNGKAIEYLVDNYSTMSKEFFMGVIYSGEKIGNKLQTSESFVDHEPKYSMLFILNDQHKYLTFTEDALKNEKSLFLEYNKALTSFKFFELIEKEIKKE
jgi:hypothetical protein